MAVAFPFEDVGNNPFGKILRPVAKVTLAGAVSIWMVVDTGADYTIVPRHFSKTLKISLENDCQKDVTFGVGGTQPIYFLKSKISATIGNMERKIPLAFFDTNEVPALLGRLGFMETFNTEFLKNHTVIFRE